MFFNTFAAAASLLLGVSTALPQATEGPLAPDAKFTLMSLRSGSEIHYASFEAAKSSIFLKLPSQNASCDAGPAEAATFFLQDGGLYLYAESATPQQLFADRSGMGQGKLGYTTGAEPAPQNAERTGFQLDANNDLTLGGASFIACPNSIDGAWSVWVSAGVEQPAGNSGCVGISARAVNAANPNGCLYTA
ncbi:cell wall protein PhiA [Annulohypoxylon truncatum]|uniref:cell wall protein PhiA n=1 Tax=Annulohypoxylon truncatum TaxID=327061 RepID=UPI002008398B|nr:cell wall protein PhiA [Annulohypoxylon truncatum]KAI1212124.1 cell wall protein PhiA [Annulohypoxylon truncatum]